MRSCRGVVAALFVALHPAVPEERLRRREVEEGWSVAGDEAALRMRPARPEAGCALTDRQAARVAGGERRQVAGHAGNVVVAAQDLVEGQNTAEPDERRPDAGRASELSDTAAGGKL